MSGESSARLSRDAVARFSSGSAVHRDPANAGRRFIPLLLGGCGLPDTFRRYKYIDFREESDAAFAEVPATGQVETKPVKRRFGLPHGAEVRAYIEPSALVSKDSNFVRGIDWLHKLHEN